MQKIINVIAVSSGIVSLAIVVGGVSVYVSRDAIIDGIKSQIMGSVTESLPGVGALEGLGDFTVPTTPKPTANTGGGGGGASTSSGGNSSGGAGGSGIVILRYLGTPIASGGTITQNGGYTIHSFTQVGNSNLVVSSGGTSTSTASFDEGSAVGTVVATLTATDTDTTNLTYSLATGNGTTDQHNSLFTVSGTQLLVASSTISYDTTTSLNVNLKVSDGDNILTKAFQIAVNDLNRAPTDIGLTSNTITENASPSTVIGTLSSVDLDTTDTTSFTLASSGDAQDDDNGSFTISGTSLILNSSPDYETKASYNIYINVNDGANNYAKAFTVSVTNVNEAPTDIRFDSNVIENGLIMYLDATNPNSRGTNQWKDLSGNGNHATVNGATLVSDSYYSLDGNDWFNWTTDVLTTDGPYTMQGFIKTTNTNWNGSNAFYNTYRSDKGIWWHFNTNGTLGWRHYGNGGTNGNLSGFNFVQNQWQMVTLTFDGSNLKLYIDKNGTLSVVQGQSERDPLPPSQVSPSMMELATIAYPAYLYNPGDADIYLTDNRRYTMRDIGKLENRIEGLERTTTLSLSLIHI